MKKTFILVLLAVITTGAIHFVQAQITSRQPNAHTPQQVESPRLLTNATVVLVNNSGASAYRAVFMQNGNETSYLFPSTGSTTYSSVLPQGTYTLGVAPVGGSSSIRTFSYSIGPDYGSQTGTSATFYNVNITSGGTITVSIN